MKIPNKHIPTREVRDETAQKALVKNIDRPSTGAWALWSVILELRERIDELEKCLNVPSGQRWVDRFPPEGLAIYVPDPVVQTPSKVPYSFSGKPPKGDILSAQDISPKVKKRKPRQSKKVTSSQVDSKESKGAAKDDLVGL